MNGISAVMPLLVHETTVSSKCGVTVVLHAGLFNDFTPDFADLQFGVVDYAEFGASTGLCGRGIVGLAG